MDLDHEAFKDGQRRVWSAGEYAQVAPTIERAAQLLVERVGVRSGEDILDVATGTGSVAIPAAQLGARVIGLDLAPKLLELAGTRASEAGVDVRWLQGDAEALPFAEASFDRVTSSFGVIFAPRQQVAADELVRVARPGATIGFTAWTPEGLNGLFFKTLADYIPPPPGLESPVRWGEEDHVRSLLQGSGAELTFERHAVTFVHDSPEAWMAFHERTLGPMVLAKAALGPQGRWPELREAMVALYAERNESEDGSFSARAEYMLTVARIPAGAG